MKLNIFTLAATVTMGMSTLTAAEVTFEEGNWAAAKIAQSCYVFSQYAAKNTSGTLVFSFDSKGFNTSFTYVYAPWGNETEAPWDENDSVLLEVDGKGIWLGDEMSMYPSSEVYAVGMTSGFVPEMIASMLAAESSVSVNFERVAKGEVWNYGTFSTNGFSASLAKAAKYCEFDPKNLPSS